MKSAELGEGPLFLFDGHCVLCTSGVAWLMRNRRADDLRFASAQSPLGRDLFARFGEDPDQTYLLVIGGEALGRSDGYLELCRLLGGPWHLLRALRMIPRRWRDGLYDLVARKRYRWFGTTSEQCALLTPEQRARLLA
jgi:predicted DCC family thiol-disulfide oxidoreductase YuxK